MDNTIYGLLGSGGAGLGLDAMGLLGNGQPPSAFGQPGMMPGGGVQGGAQPIPNVQPGMPGQGGAMMAPGAHPMPQAASPMTSAPQQPQQQPGGIPTVLGGLLGNATGMPAGAAAAGATGGAQTGIDPRFLRGAQTGLALAQANAPHTIPMAAPSMLGGGGFAYPRRSA